MIGLAGATMAGSGQYLHANSLKNAKNQCIDSGRNQKTCEKEFKSPYSMINTILMYAGSGFIVAGFLVVWFLSSSFFGPRGYGMGGMGMMGMGGMY